MSPHDSGFLMSRNENGQKYCNKYCTIDLLKRYCSTKRFWYHYIPTAFWVLFSTADTCHLVCPFSFTSSRATCGNPTRGLTTWTKKTRWRWRRRCTWRSTGNSTVVIQHNMTFSINTVESKNSHWPYVFEHRFSLASHFFWGLWSLIQARLSTIQFGYLVSKVLRFGLMTSVFAWVEKI